MKACAHIFFIRILLFSLSPLSLSLSILYPLSFSFFLSYIPLSILPISLSSRQQSEEAMALKASTSSKSREVSPEMMEKIIQGKVSKRMSDICLLNQVENNFVKCDRSSYRSLCEFFH